MDKQDKGNFAEFTIENPNNSETHLKISECLRNLKTNPGELIQGRLKRMRNNKNKIRYLNNNLSERYFILELLCNGLMSKVFLCWDVQVKRYVVIKIPKDEDYDVEMVSYDIIYLRAAHDCHPTDPRRVRIIQIFEDVKLRCLDGIISCAVLEAMEGTVLDLINDSTHNSLPLAIVKNITRQLLQGLDYLHFCKIIHTDIKPENILYINGNDSLSNLHIKIADLGNACYEHNQISSEIQTPSYRSPEVILEAGYDTSADIWSAACVIFELATGEYLFNVKHDNCYIRDILHLAVIIEYLGPIPHRILSRGRKSSKLFDEFGKLLCITKIYSNNILNELLNRYSWSLTDAQAFAAFLEYMLKLDPANRPTAAECLQHPWLN